MEDKPLISVIMPAYNCENTIRASVRSALRQTMGGLELIIADDCSTDRTPEIIAELALSDSRIKVICGKVNGGVVAARNSAINASFGEFLAFLDSDDLWEPYKLERQLAKIRDTGCDLCYSSYDYFDKNGNSVYNPYLVPESTDYKRLLKENVIGLSTVVLKKSSLSSLRFDKRFFHEDFALWLALLRTGVTMRGVHDVLTHNQVGGRSENKWMALKNRWQIYRKAENMSIGKSCWYLSFYILAGIIKYRKR